MTDFEIVKLEEKHLESTAELEALCFAHPWTSEGLKTLVREGGVGFAAVEKENGRVISYAGMVMAADMADITDVATHPDCRRQGLSRAVMERILGYAKEQGMTSVALDVRVSNSGAIALYEGLGFEIAGKRPRFYRTPPEDAYVMIKQL
ncbi:MAG: ribosomal protein S18-alanine N-acetyltransferase [Clostridia bacterium]|nr:ribosomal protein S18-alanine N-acetyltransferase [Clostridia bacterium]